MNTKQILANKYKTKKPIKDKEREIDLIENFGFPTAFKMEDFKRLASY
jgi:chorismate mutase